MKKYGRMKQVQEHVPVSKTTILTWVREGKFPKPIKLSGRCTVWDLEEVINFIEQAGK
uniref:Phage transcriptional regulator, AlpA n=1 Tax=Geobacter sp. (strain M21) TaxID=443144 RepID=C6E2B8_GEOSM